MSGARAFYDGPDQRAAWGREAMPEERRALLGWLDRLHAEGPSLELGCGAGALAEAGPGYIALDLALAPLRAMRRRVNADMEQLPFAAESLGCIYSWAALEHVPHPERVLAEIARVLRRGGVAVLAPAWHCRPWAAEGLATRPYDALTPSQKVRKALIPLRDSLVWRAASELPRRAVRELLALRGPIAFHYQRLQPNLTEYIGTDSDAFTSMDPQAMALWFASRGFEVVSHPSRAARMRATHEPVVVRKR